MSNEETRRVFSVEGAGDFFIAAPTADDVRNADWFYSKQYNKALFEGVATIGEMQDALRKRGIIGDSYDKRLQELRDTIGNKIVEMELSDNKDIKRRRALEIAKLREELFQWTQRVSGPLSHSAEQMAEDARLEYLVSCVVQKADGNKVWNTFEDYLKESNRVLSFRARFETLLLLQGLESTFLENTPENVVLRKLEEEGPEQTTPPNEVPPSPALVAVEILPEESAKPRRKRLTKGQ